MLKLVKKRNSRSVQIPPLVIANIFNIRIINELPQMIAYEVDEMIKHEPIYENMLKKKWKKFMKDVKDYETRMFFMNKTLNNTFAEVNDIVEEGVRHDIDNLESLILEQLEIIHQKKSKLLAKFQLLGIMIQYAMVIYNKRLEALKNEKKILFVDDMLAPYSLEYIFKSYSIADYEIRKKLNFFLYIDFVNDDTMIDALAEISYKMQQSELVIDALKDANLIHDLAETTAV